MDSNSHAIHEAGHAVVVFALCPERIIEVSIVPESFPDGNIQWGYTRWKGPRESLEPYNGFPGSLFIAAAGMMAEVIKFGPDCADSMDCACDQVELITGIAQLVNQQAKSPVAPELALDHIGVTPEVQGMISEVMYQTMLIIKKQEALFEAIIAELLATKKVNKARLLELYKEHRVD